MQSKHSGFTGNTAMSDGHNTSSSVYVGASSTDAESPLADDYTPSESDDEHIVEGIDVDDDEDSGDDDDDSDNDDLRYASTPAESRQLIADSTGNVTECDRDRKRTQTAGRRSTAGHGRPKHFQAYTHALGRTSGRHHRSKLYSPWTIFSLTILFFLFLYIPLFNTFRESAGMYPIPGWELNTTRDTTYYVLPQYNTTLIDPVHVCEDRVFLLMVVCSSAHNFEIRDSIRQTWANMTEFNYSFFRKAHAKLRGQYLDINYPHWQNYTTTFHDTGDAATSSTTGTAATTDSSSALPKSDAAMRRRPEYADFAVKIVFLVGQTPSNETQSRIAAESDLYGDLIQETFLDSYNNLTLKTIMMLKWVTVNCGDRVQFLMKCDDDTFVNVPNLLHVLLGGTIPAYNASVQEFDQSTIQTRQSRNRLRTANAELLIGSRFCNSKPISNTSSKWYTPVYMYSGNIYPNYLSGTGYVMSMAVAARLYNASLATPIFHLEDVYLTGICAEAAHIRPANHQLFSYTSYRNPCELRGMITKHQLTASHMRRAYEFVRDVRSTNCPPPDRFVHVRKAKTNVRSCS